MRLTRDSAVKAMAVCLAALVGCTAPTPATTRAVPADFRFVRGNLELMSPEQMAWAEERLREIAMRSGVYGVVLVGARFDDPPVFTRPAFEEVAEMGGQVLIALCAPDSCDLSTASAYSDGLADEVEAVAPAPEPAPGRDPPLSERNLRSWVEFVGAVASIRN